MTTRSYLNKLPSHIPNAKDISSRHGFVFCVFVFFGLFVSVVRENRYMNISGWQVGKLLLLAEAKNGEDY